MSKKNSVPKGWQNFTNLGKQLPGTSFIAFKVPLRQEICNKLPHDQWFMPKNLLGQVPNLKLIINLTNAESGRYYYYPDMEDAGVKVVQIFCEGHGVLPPAQKFKIFYDTVDDFLRHAKGSQRGNELIGVHCTHGLNRTGLFICKYLVERMNMAPDAAIELFETARGHQIERHQYKNHLLTSHSNGGGNGGNPSASRQSHGSQGYRDFRPVQSVQYNQYQQRPRSQYSDYSGQSGYMGPSRSGRFNYRESRDDLRAREEVSNWRDRDYRNDPNNSRVYRQDESFRNRRESNFGNQREPKFANQRSFSNSRNNRGSRGHSSGNYRRNDDRY